MKSFEEAYAEVMASDELKERFAAAQSPADITAFIKELGVEATPEEIVAFLKGKLTDNADLSVDDLDQVAGGKGVNEYEATVSVLTVGIGCALWVGASAIMGGNLGTDIESDDRMLCE